MGVLSLSALLWAGRALADDADVGDTDPPVVIRSQVDTPDGVRTVVQIPAQRDAFITSAQPNANHGFADTLRLGYDASQYQAARLLIQFSLSSISMPAYIHSAQLVVYQAGVLPPGDAVMPYGAQYLKSGWAEGLITWNTTNNLGSANQPLSGIDNAAGWKTFDVSPAVRGWLSGAAVNYGLIISGDEGATRNRSRVFYSRQKPGYAPYLVVDYTVSCDTGLPVATINALPAFSPGTYLVTWGGYDVAPPGCTPTGIAAYDVQYRINGQTWVAWASATVATSRQFFYAGNDDYVEFRARAVDGAGNLQAFTDPQAATRVDTQPPASMMNGLPPFTIASAFTVTWRGSDNLSGIQSYDVQVRAGNGPWESLVENTTATAHLVTGAEPDQTYQFRVHAVDNVNNSERWPDDYQAVTTVLDHPITLIDPIQPPIVKPTDIVTDSFSLTWTSYTAPDIAINRYEVWARYQDNPWTLWQNAVRPCPTQCVGGPPGAGASTAITFTWLNQSLGGVPLGDGRYEFEILAIPAAGDSEPRTSIAEAVTYVDMADAIKARAYLPMIAHTAR